MGVRTAVSVIALAAFTARVGAQPLRLADVVHRLSAYIDRVDERLSSVVAEEQYRQELEISPLGVIELAERRHLPRPAAPHFTYERRTIRSDYALVRDASRDAWVGFRDTFEVDGQPLRDREDRLQRLLATGALAEAEQIANESARFNLGADFVVRNVNVPTLVLQLLQSRYRDRFSFRKTGEETIDGVPTWRIEYRERRRPTIIRTSDGHDQPSHGWVWVGPATGEIRRTAVLWDDVRSTITVDFGRAEGIDVMVPLEMTERYERGGATVTGDATYTNFRQFQTGARVVAPQ
jgi:hypothetical protein